MQAKGYHTGDLAYPLRECAYSAQYTHSRANVEAAPIIQREIFDPTMLSAHPSPKAKVSNVKSGVTWVKVYLNVASDTATAWVVFSSWRRNMRAR